MTLPGLTEFFTRSVNDNRIGSSHISLYMAMFQKWQLNSFQNPVHITRRELMQLSHINAKNTYHKCLQELIAFGYINYIPSYHPVLGSMIYMNVMQAKNTEPCATS